jgi:hypothetical protein
MACTKLQQTIGAFESLGPGLRNDGSHLHRNVGRNNLCMRGVELAIGGILVDDGTRGCSEHESILRRDRAKSLR